MDLTEKLLSWYDQNKRALPWRENREPYNILLSEIMLQQTRSAAAIPYYRRFLEALPTLKALAQCPPEELLKLWEGLGYYSRAKNLQKCAQILLADHGGRFPREAAALEKLPGIGPYTAGALSSIAFNEPEPAVDGNLVRILSRVYLYDGPADDPAVRAYWTAFLKPAMGKRPGELNQAYMDLGALLCLPKNPRCPECPLRELCLAAKTERQGEFPKRREKKPRPVKALTVFVLRSGESFLIRRRPPKGLLGGLWELPNREGKLTKEEWGEALSSWGARPAGEWRITNKKHIFTHLIWEMQVVEVKIAPGYSGELLLYSGREPLPSAFLKCLS